MGLFAKYMMEREGKHIIERDWGFASYKFKQDHVYLEDVYIEPESRKKGLASELAELVCEEARKSDLPKVITSVDLRANNPGLGMRAILGYGFEPYICENDIVYFIKNV